MSRPCLVVGLGGLGCRIVRACRRAHAEMPEEYRVPAGFVGIDLATDREQSDEDFVQISTSALREVLSHLDVLFDGRPAWEGILDWFPDRRKYSHLPELPEGTGQARPLGRLSLWTRSHLDAVRRLLGSRLEQLRCAGGGQDNRRPDILIVTSSWGGTGSALMLDIASILRSCTPIGRMELFLALPQKVSNEGSRHRDLTSLQNAFATLVDLALASRFPSRALGLGSGSLPAGPTGPAECGVELATFVVSSCGSDAANTVDSITELVKIRMYREIALAVADWRRSSVRVQFRPRPIRGNPMLSAAYGVTFPLVQIDRSFSKWREVLIDAWTGAGPASDSMEEWVNPAIESELRHFEQRINGLIQEESEASCRFEAFLRLVGNTEPGQKLERSAEVQLVAELRKLVPRLNAASKSPSSEDLKALLEAFGDESLFAKLKDLAERIAEKLGKEVAEQMARLDPILEAHVSQLDNALASQDEHKLTRRQISLCIEEMQRFEKALDDIPSWRRLPMAGRLKERNRKIWLRLGAETLKYYDRAAGLDPVIHRGSFHLLQEALRSRKKARSLSREDGGSDAESAQVVEIGEHSAYQPAVDRGSVADERQRRALRCFADRCKLDRPEKQKIIDKMAAHLESSGAFFVAEPDAGNLEETIRSCQIDVFVGRVSAEATICLLVLLPDRLIWPEGDRGLDDQIRANAQSISGPPLRILRGPADRMVFYLEEFGQPLQNLEALEAYRTSYFLHPEPSTLHIDRRWIESEEGEQILSELRLESARRGQLLLSGGDS